MEFKSNVMNLSAWGNQDSVKRGQANGLKKMNRGKGLVTCTECFQRMKKQAMRKHKKTCIGAKGQM